LKLELNDSDLKEALAKISSGFFEAADGIVDTCDNSLVRKILKGVVKESDKAIRSELTTRTILEKTKVELPANVSDIDENEEETGSVEEQEITGSAQITATTKAEVGPLSDG
jgi:hypothetical protein